MISSLFCPTSVYVSDQPMKSSATDSYNVEL